jgi:hypothetical protein
LLNDPLRAKPRFQVPLTLIAGRFLRTVAHATFPISFVFEEEFTPPVRDFSIGKSRSVGSEERVFSSRRELADEEEFRPQPASPRAIQTTTANDLCSDYFAHGAPRSTLSFSSEESCLRSPVVG